MSPLSTAQAAAPSARPVRLLALACDYDGTLAHHGRVDDSTIAALERVVKAGRRLLLVTGRELEDLQRVFSRFDLFDRVVAENGAVLFEPATGEITVLTEPASQALAQALRDRNVTPLSVGHAIIATWEPNEGAVLEAIHELGLELQLIFNKGAVMVLPSGVNKASGLEAALAAMHLSARNTIGVGDAQNDHAFLSDCQVAVAVANALPALRESADVVTSLDHGGGVAELIDEWLRDDLASRARTFKRHRLALGIQADGGELLLDPNAAVVLIAGTSGSGKSTAAIGLLEGLGKTGYSFCVIDPEGDYEGLHDALGLGSSAHPLSVDEAMELLTRQKNVVLNLLGLPLEDRPGFFRSLWARVQELRSRTGQPHWLVLDEAHHLLRHQPHSGADEEIGALDRVIMLTAHPALMPAHLLRSVDVMMAVGREAAATMRQFADASSRDVTLPLESAPPEQGQALVWTSGGSMAAQTLTLPASRTEHRRHIRKYAQGELPEDRSFYFRGPHDKLNLRAQNLVVFLQIAEGVDDETWLHHLRGGDYSRWMESAIKDKELASAVRDIEASSAPDPSRTRELVRQVIERLYTLPG
jgi:HAD superfamily hydrolase (TIGR01484 family)